MKTIYLTHTDDGRYILSDTAPELVEDWKDGVGKTGEYYYDPIKGWYVETDSDICEIFGIRPMDEDTYTEIEIR